MLVKHREKKRKRKMLPLKLVRSLILGETINRHSLPFSQNHHHVNDNKEPTTTTPLLLFLPTKEIVRDTYRLASIARDMGIDFYPTPSLSHIIFSYPPSSLSLPNDAVLLPFPSLTTSSLSHLRAFVSLSKGLFKLVFIATATSESKLDNNPTSNWNCCSISLFSRLTGDRIDSMEAFCRALAGMGWTLFNTNRNPSHQRLCGGGAKSMYLFRKVYSGRVRGNGECRIRELRLPTLDFWNAPLRILQYVVLMTHDVFYLA